MAASVDYGQEQMSSGENTEKEKSDDLSLLVDFSDKNLNLKLLQKSDLFQETLGSESGNPLMPKTISVMHGQNHPGADDLLNSEEKSTDYDRLLSAPGNPPLSLKREEENLISNGPKPRVRKPSTTKPPPMVAAAATKPKRSITPTPRRSSIRSTPRSLTPTPTRPSAIPTNPSLTKLNNPPLKNKPLTNAQAPPNSKKYLPKRNSKGENDDVNPVLMGTKMVERVVNMRKLPPPNHDNNNSNGNNTCGKLSGSQDKSGFGRTLSKKSFDMALRHLDIRRSMPGNMRAMMTKVPASSVYSVRSDAPRATSSNSS